MQRGETAKAQLAYQELLVLSPKDAQLHNNYALVLSRKNDPKAVDVASQAQALSPNDPHVNDTLGWLLVNNGEVKRGLTFLRKS
jgi:Flp pilus assembly protein TadD